MRFFNSWACLLVLRTIIETWKKSESCICSFLGEHVLVLRSSLQIPIGIHLLYYLFTLTWRTVMSSSSYFFKYYFPSLLPPGLWQKYAVPYGMRTRLSWDSKTSSQSRSFYLSNNTDWQRRTDPSPQSRRQQSRAGGRISARSGINDLRPNYA